MSPSCCSAKRSTCSSRRRIRSISRTRSIPAGSGRVATSTGLTIDLSDEAAVLQLLDEAEVHQLVGVEALGPRILGSDLIDDPDQAFSGGIGSLRPDVDVRVIAGVGEALVLGFEVGADDLFDEGGVLFPTDDRL